MSQVDIYNTGQEPDAKPGAYYVTVVRDDGAHRRLLGPFVNDHAGALEAVRDARDKAEELDPRAVWYSFGTARLPEYFNEPGILNDYLPGAC